MRRGARGNRSYADLGQIELAAPGAEREDVTLAPAVGARQRVHVLQDALGPRRQLAPEVRLDVQRNHPGVTAGRAGEIERGVGVGIGRGHRRIDCLPHVLRHGVNVDRFAVALGADDAPRQKDITGIGGITVARTGHQRRQIGGRRQPEVHPV